MDIVQAYAIRSRRGSNPTKPNKVNQDSYFICQNFARCKNAWFVGVCDGHGSNGHFVSDCIRVYDETICHGCWNDPKFRFDKGNWKYCPEHEDTPRHFECHKLIKSDRVIKLIQQNENI